ncbi:cell wall hydrolase [Mesorhizobium sp. M0091]|uniref:cell wall hydrolase n=1 Tax=Mesorhizobium sp. M0091 TaxID=2956875 RepID=UPI00333DBD66
MTIAIAKFAVFLRSTPGGDLTDHRILAETELTVLGEANSADGKKWINVDDHGTAGWTRPDNLRGTALVRSIGEKELAAVSVAVAKDLQTNAGYLLAVAHVESRDDWRNGVITANVDNKGAFAPYRFTNDSWKVIADTDRGRELGVREAGLSFPDQQCLAVGLKSKQDSEVLTKNLERFVTSLDLYLAHIFGVTAAIALREPSAQEKKLGDLLDKLGLSANALQDLLANRGLLTMEAGADAVVSTFLERCGVALQAGLDRAATLLRDFSVELPDSSDASFNDIPADFKGVVIKVEPDDVDALGRLCSKEVGVFKMFGEQVLADGVGAVVDTVFNRIVDDSTEFENTIQAVIDEKFQFSPILATPHKTWRELQHSEEVSAIVDAHLKRRALGGSSVVLGAMHFFNPHASTPDWGPEVKAHPTFIGGNPDTDSVHYHGFPRKQNGSLYKPPGPYVIFHAGRGHAFNGDGSAMAALSAPTDDGDATKLLREHIANGKVRFQPPKDKLRGMLLGTGNDGSATPLLRRLVLHLASVVDTFIEISSIVRPGGGSFHQTGQAVDIGNEDIAGKLLPKVAIQSVVDQFRIDEIIFDSRKVGFKTNRFNFNGGSPHTFDDTTINQHGNHIHFAVKA